MTEQYTLFDLPADARVPRRNRSSRPTKPRTATVTTVPMPDPVLPARPEPRVAEGPCLAGMEEVGTGMLDHADAMQRVAASAPPGPLLINAGPGTGKTHVLMRRIAYHIVELRVPPSQCLVLAPDADAVRAMREQLSQLLGESADALTVVAFGDLSKGTIPPLGHVFVDDLHRMSLPLYDALRADRSRQPALTVTADPDSLVDGEASAVERFPRDYTEARAVRLSRNYRNTPPMIAAATQLLSGTTRTPDRAMLPHRPACGVASIGRYFAIDAHDEWHFAAKLPERLAAFGVAPEEVVIVRADDAAEPPGLDTVPLRETAGKQYRVVCLLGTDDGSFPDTPSARRALYTAITRAQDLLYLTHTGPGSPLLNEVDSGLFAAFGQVEVAASRVEQPRLL